MRIQFRWRNVPIPEGHVSLLLLSAGLQLVSPRPLFAPSRVRRACGWPLVLAGSLLAGWAVMAAADVDIDRPGQLVTTGPYAFSRNPMYAGWTLIYLGAACLLNTRWALAMLPVLLTLTHLDVRGEEQRLGQTFGEVYRRYARRVPRYG